jgi:hypothetical protein
MGLFIFGGGGCKGRMEKLHIKSFTIYTVHLILLGLLDQEG